MQPFTQRTIKQEKMSGIYRYEFTVPEDVVDENNHVNNVVYVQWMQDAAVRHSEDSGCTESTRSVGATWVVRSHKIEYLRPAFAGDRLEVQTWIVNFRRVRTLRRYRFVRVTDNTLLARGETDWIFVDAETGRSRSIPHNVASALQIVPAEREP